MNELTPKENRDFVRLNRTILRRVKAVKQFWLALVEIHDRRLYRRHFANFEAYLESIPEVGRIRGYQLLNAGRVSSFIPITTERQARVLAGLPQTVAKEIWAEGQERFGSQPNGGQLKMILAEKVTQAEAAIMDDEKRPAPKKEPAEIKVKIEELIARARRLNAGLPQAAEGETKLLSYLDWLRQVS